MAEVTIIVEFETLDGKEAEFTRIISDHARRTLQEEPGCKRFEVIKPVDDDFRPLPNVVVVNELYADQAAVIAHRANPRMKPLGQATAPLLRSRRLIMAAAIGGAAADEGKRPEELSAANDD